VAIPLRGESHSLRKRKHLSRLVHECGKVGKCLVHGLGEDLLSLLLTAQDASDSSRSRWLQAAANERMCGRPQREWDSDSFHPRACSKRSLEAE
jgi:hypothetical protein